MTFIDEKLSAAAFSVLLIGTLTACQPDSIYIDPSLQSSLVTTAGNSDPAAVQPGGETTTPNDPTTPTDPTSSQIQLPAVLETMRQGDIRFSALGSQDPTFESTFNFGTGNVETLNNGQPAIRSSSAVSGFILCAEAVGAVYQVLCLQTWDTTASSQAWYHFDYFEDVGAGDYEFCGPETTAEACIAQLSTDADGVVVVERVDTN